jgi:hypothetical protein
VPKVHNKPIKRLRKGSNKESKRHPKRHPGLAHRTIRCTRALEVELATFGKFRGRSAIIHRTVSGEAPDSVRCHTGLSGVPAEQRLLRTQRSSANTFNALQCAPESEHAQLAHRTVYRTCPVHHQTAQRPHKSELQQSNPNGPLTWLAHRTVSGAPCDSSLPTATFWRLGL